MITFHIIFWSSLFVVFWTYLGYGVALKLLSLVYRKELQQVDIEPEITVVITAYNEERLIARKIENTLELKYPKEKLEIIVVSDASSDRTDEIVGSFADRNVRLLRIPKRRGKHYGQRHGIQQARHDIIVCTDATTFLEPDAVAKVVRNLADPTVGCVSGTDRISSPNGEEAGEGAYVRYEMKLRALEYRVGSLVGVSGCFFCIRKELTSTWFDYMSSDFYLPILTRMAGFRTVADPEAIGSYEVLRDTSKEFTRKVRTVVHGLEVLFLLKNIMNVFKYGLFSIQIISHKLMRWLVPFCLVAALASNVILFERGIFYQLIFTLQIVFYFMALLAFIVKPLQQISLFRLPLFFVVVNVSIAVAWYKYLTGQEYIVWNATER